jgi:hypothetical protein
MISPFAGDAQPSVLAKFAKLLVFCGRAAD